MTSMRRGSSPASSTSISCRGASRWRKKPVTRPEPEAALISASKRPCSKKRADAKAPERYGLIPVAASLITRCAPSSPYMRPSCANDARLPGKVSTSPRKEGVAVVIAAWTRRFPTSGTGRPMGGPDCQPLHGGRTQGESSSGQSFRQRVATDPSAASGRSSRKTLNPRGAPIGKV